MQTHFPVLLLVLDFLFFCVFNNTELGALGISTEETQGQDFMQKACETKSTKQAKQQKASNDF